MPVNFSYSIPVRKRNGLQNCIYNMISKLDTASPIHTEKEVRKDTTQHVNNGLFLGGQVTGDSFHSVLDNEYNLPC